MKVIKIEPGGNIYEKDIVGDLKSLQEEVGGLITLAPIFDNLKEMGVDIYADDEGLSKENNRTSLVRIDKIGQIDYGIVGNVILAGRTEDGDTKGLDDNTIKYIMDHYSIIKLFDRITNKSHKCITFLYGEALRNLLNFQEEDDE